MQRGRDARNKVRAVDREQQTQTIDACPPDRGTIDRVLGGAHHDPHSVLGAHPHPNGTVVRALRPHAAEVAVLVDGDEQRAYPLVQVHDAGLWSGRRARGARRLPAGGRYGDDVDTVDDPYRWLPTLGEIDLHLIGEGRHERLWDVLGAHVRTYDTPSGTVTGTSFAVWAPTARGVRVTGDFDGWAGWRTRCARWAAPACGRSSCPASASAPATSSGSSARTARGARRPTRWRSPPRSRRPPRRSSRRSTTSGTTPSGWRAARPAPAHASR